MTSCYGTYMVVGINIKREMVLSPNDEEVANSSKNIPNSFRPKQLKKHTVWHGTYLYSLYKRLSAPRGKKRIADYESRKRD